MLRRTLLLLPLAVSAGAGGPAFGQANLRPDPTPRVPPQPGQGLPAEDVAYLRRGARLDQLGIEAGRLAAERAASDDVKQFGARSVTEIERSRQALATLAQARHVALDGQDEPEGRGRQTLEELRAAAPGQTFERAYLAQQLGLLKTLAELHQAEASQSTDQGLARFAITTLVAVRARLDAAQALGTRYGLSAGTLGNPPQY